MSKITKRIMLLTNNNTKTAEEKRGENIEITNLMR